MRQSWSDDRLDHLNDRVDEGFAQVNQRFDRVEAEAREFRAEMASRLDRIDAGFERMEDRFDRVHQTTLIVLGSVFGTVMLVFSGLLATTQL